MQDNLEKVKDAAKDPTNAATGKPPEERKRIISKWGQFTSRPQVEFLDNGKQVILLRDFEYIRPDGDSMIAMAGFISDGASVPKIAWPIADSPFTGKNFFPALIHDYYCKLGKEGLSPYGSADVHYMFHQGLRARGENAWLARPKWFAVKKFGPKFGPMPPPNVLILPIPVNA